MAEDFFIKKTYLINLYKRVELYIMSNYPDIIIKVNEKSVSLSYPGEWARIFIYQNKENNALIVRLTQDLDSKMSETNGIQFYLSSVEDLNALKSGIRAILGLKRHPLINEDYNNEETTQSKENVTFAQSEAPIKAENTPNKPKKKRFFSK